MLVILPSWRRRHHRRDRGVARGRSPSHGRDVLHAVFFLGNALSFYATRRGKFVVWNNILDGLHLRGDERVSIWAGRGAYSSLSQGG
jgi:hypothetical protein